MLDKVLSIFRAHELTTALCSTFFSFISSSVTVLGFERFSSQSRRRKHGTRRPGTPRTNGPGYKLCWRTGSEPERAGFRRFLAKPTEIDSLGRFDRRRAATVNIVFLHDCCSSAATATATAHCNFDTGFGCRSRAIGGILQPHPSGGVSIISFAFDRFSRAIWRACAAGATARGDFWPATSGRATPASAPASTRTAISTRLLWSCWNTLQYKLFRLPTTFHGTTGAL